MKHPYYMSPIDADTANQAASARIPDLTCRWIARGALNGSEHVRSNPTRSARPPSSLRINVDTGSWRDPATGDAGGDLVSLRACIDGSSWSAASRAI